MSDKLTIKELKKVIDFMEADTIITLEKQNNDHKYNRQLREKEFKDSLEPVYDNANVMLNRLKNLNLADEETDMIENMEFFFDRFQIEMEDMNRPGCSEFKNSLIKYYHQLSIPDEDRDMIEINYALTLAGIQTADNIYMRNNL